MKFGIIFESFNFEPPTFENAARYLNSETNSERGHDIPMSSLSLVKFGPRTPENRPENRKSVHPLKLNGDNVINGQLENVAIANALHFEAARRRAVPIRFNFVARVKFERALPIRCRFREFLQRVGIACYADGCISHGRVCLSVCLSPSHSGVLSKRMKLRSCGFHQQVGQSS